MPSQHEWVKILTGLSWTQVTPHFELYTLENTSQDLHRSTNTMLGFIFPLKNGNRIRNQFFQTGFVKGSWHAFHYLFQPCSSVNCSQYSNDGTFQAPFLIFISFLWILEEKWIFHIHENNLILQFLGPKCRVTWSNAFYFSVGQKEYNLYLYLNLTWLDLRETVFSVWIQNTHLPVSRILQ